jgi:orotidine-5'-phosphate decarboxylase
MKDKRVIVALDVNSIEEVRALIEKIGDNVSTFKVGMRLFTKYGPELVKELISKGYDVFLDLKYHDIPNTVETACAEAAELGVKMMTIHASGGREMCRSAVKGAKEGAKRANKKAPVVLAVTVLTSITESYLIELGIKKSVEDHVLDLAKMAINEGVGGVVCSALEVKKLKAEISTDFVSVVPGIRLPDTNLGDQKRVAGPDTAIKDGADYIVVGRPVYAATDPVRALRDIYSLTTRIG